MAQGNGSTAAAVTQTAQREHDTEACGGHTAAMSASTKGPHDMLQGSACTPAVCGATAEPVPDMMQGDDSTALVSTSTAEAKQDMNHEASAACSHDGCKPGSIFVSIAAYRDPECQWTIRDLFRQAEEAELVTVGVVWQIDAVADAAFVRVAGNAQRHRQVTSLLVSTCAADIDAFMLSSLASCMQKGRRTCF